MGAKDVGGWVCELSPHEEDAADGSWRSKGEGNGSAVERDGKRRENFRVVREENVGREEPNDSGEFRG